MYTWICRADGLDIEIKCKSFRRLEVFSKRKLVGRGRTGLIRGCLAKFPDGGREVEVEVWNYGGYGMYANVAVDGVTIVGAARTYYRRGSRDISQT